jgi:hypothetical protein
MVSIFMKNPPAAPWKKRAVSKLPSLPEVILTRIRAETTKGPKDEATGGIFPS